MRVLLIVCFLIYSVAGQSQKARQDSILNSITDYEEFFNELENFIDSITAPRSFATVNTGFSSGFFPFYSESEGSTVKRKMLLTPSAGYYHRNGLGISLQGAAIMDKGAFVPFQMAATVSYDYLQNRSLMTGFSYARIFTKDSLSFYTSPLSNEINGYFTYRRSWLKPMLSASYGWGSRRSFEEVQKQYSFLRIASEYRTSETVESIHDFTLTASVRHDFYWLGVLDKKDFVRLTPQLSLVAGTQKFGFNQTDNAFLSRKKGGRELMYQTHSEAFKEQTAFQPLALSANVKTEWSKGIFFIQPQLYADYLLGTAYKKLITSVALNTGIIF